MCVQHALPERQAPVSMTCVRHALPEKPMRASVHVGLAFFGAGISAGFRPPGPASRLRAVWVQHALPERLTTGTKIRQQQRV